jgi:hypothetical protein
MIGMVTAVLTGSAAGLLATIAAGHSAVAGFATGGVVGVAVLVALMWFQYRPGRRPTSNGSLRMSKKGQTRGNGQDRRAISVTNHGQGGAGRPPPGTQVGSPDAMTACFAQIPKLIVQLHPAVAQRLADLARGPR